MAAKVPFDVAAALEHMAGDMDLLKEVAGVFLTDHPHQIEQIDAALAAGDAEAAMHAAHSLKGSVGSFAAAGAFDAANAVETAARHGDLAAGRAEFETLGAEIACLKAAMATFLGPRVGQDSTHTSADPPDGPPMHAYPLSSP